MASADIAMLTALDANTHTAAQIFEAFQRDGAVIVHNMLSDDVRSQLRNELAESMRDTRPGTKSSDSGVQEFWGSNTKRFTRLAMRSMSAEVRDIRVFLETGCKTPQKRPCRANDSQGDGVLSRLWPQVCDGAGFCQENIRY